MLKRRLAAVLALGCAAVIAGCERVVGIDLAASSPRLVVQGRIERVKDAVTGRQRIQLTTTSDYFGGAAAPPAVGARVRVVDVTTGAGTTFAETSPGVFETSTLVGTPGRRYRLEIDYEGDRYEGTDQLAEVTRIRQLYFQEGDGVIGQDSGLRATINLQDTQGIRNWYAWDQFVDGVRVALPDSNFRSRVIANDELIDGQFINGFQPYSGVVIKPGSQVLIRQIGLSEQAYKYYFALGDQAASNGSPFAVPPATVRGNVYNRTRPERFPLGYFMAGEVSEIRRTLQ